MEHKSTIRIDMINVGERDRPCGHKAMPEKMEPIVKRASDILSEFDANVKISKHYYF